MRKPYWKTKCELCKYAKGNFRFWTCTKSSLPMFAVNTLGFCEDGYFKKKLKKEKSK